MFSAQALEPAGFVRGHMATGVSTQLTKQIGESLVVAELGRLGYVATSFTGNLPEVDVLAKSPRGKTFSVQVKAIRGASWQFDVRNYLRVELQGRKQVVQGRANGPKALICIFVQVGANREDEFYVFRWRVLQEFFFRTYLSRTRPRNPESFHCAIWPRDLADHRDKWSILPK